MKKILILLFVSFPFFIWQINADVRVGDLGVPDRAKNRYIFDERPLFPDEDSYSAGPIESRRPTSTLQVNCQFAGGRVVRPEEREYERCLEESDLGRGTKSIEAQINIQE